MTSRTAGWENDRRDPDARGHAERRPRAKKNTKKWCRGKVGVAHIPHIVLSSFNQSYQQFCRPQPEWAKEIRRPAFQKLWWCWHQEECATCGKVLRPWIPETECPECPQEIKEKTA